MEAEKSEHEQTKTEVLELQEKVLTLEETKERLEYSVKESDERLAVIKDAMGELEKKLAELAGIDPDAVEAAAAPAVVPVSETVCNND